MAVTDRKRWQEIQSLFAEAIERPVSERASFLRTACSGDEALHGSVERLLVAHESAGTFLESIDAVRAAALLAAAPEEEELPEQIGTYRIVRRLGGGGMGIVYLGHDARLDRPVALKLLRARSDSDERARRRLIAEAQAASALDHPNIVPVYEIGETPDGRLFIAMAYGGGESLAERLRSGPLPLRAAADLARQIADALAAAHRRGIIHRDVKPANVIVADGRARLVDFGVARVSGRADSPVTGAVGTLAYMSPEQTRGGEVDPRSDVWSVGVVLHEMLTGHRPFPAEDQPALIHAIRYEAPPPLQELCPDAPEPLVALTDRCLAKNPAQRPASAEAVVEALDAILRSADSPAVGPGLSLWRRAALSVAAVIIVAAGSFLVLREPSPLTDAAEPVLAVLPFAPAAQDTALDRLGRELVVTLSTTLDGAAGIRMVEPTAILARGGRSSLEDAAELARELGANQMIFGSLTRHGTTVRLDAAVHATSDLSVLARASASATPDDVTALTDLASVALLTTGWLGDRSVPNLAAITTSSVPALRAYLEGELAVSNGQFRAAPIAFARAMREDSTFWFAYWRYMYALNYHGEPVDPAITAAVIEHRRELPEPDRLLVEASLASGQRTRLELRRAITVRFPSYWPAWFDLADQLTHHSLFLGLPLEAARPPLERTASLNPRFVPAWEHLFWIAVHARDTASSGRILARLTELQLDSLLQNEWGLQTLDYYRYLDYLARNNGDPHGPQAEVGARLLAEYTGPIGPERLATSLANYGFLRAQLDMARRIRARGSTSAILAAQSWAEALSWAGRGGWDSAYAPLLQYARTTPETRGPMWAFGLATAGAWLGALHPDSVRPLRDIAVRNEYTLSADAAAEVAWLDGILACTRGHLSGVRNARARLPAGAGATPVLSRSLSAFELALQGRTAEAGRTLADLEAVNGDSAWAFRFGTRHPLPASLHRLAAAHWLLADGDTARARQLLLFFENEVPSAIHPLQSTGIVLGTFGLPTLADIEDARGLKDRARHYRALFRDRADLTPTPHPTPCTPTPQ